MKRIFLDMDGVLANFTQSAGRVFGKGPEELDWSLGHDEAHQIVGVSGPGEFWAAIDKEGPEFWANMDPFPWRDELWDLCESFAPVTIATSPSRKPASSMGKVQWLQKWKGEKFRDYILIPKMKHLLARPLTVLIDDHDKHIEGWSNAGGIGITFPQPWNYRREYKDNPIKYVESSLHWASRKTGS